MISTESSTVEKITLDVALKCRKAPKNDEADGIGNRLPAKSCQDS